MEMEYPLHAVLSEKKMRPISKVDGTSEKTQGVPRTVSRLRKVCPKKQAGKDRRPAESQKKNSGGPVSSAGRDISKDTL